MAQYRQSGHNYSNGTSDHISVGIRASSSSSAPQQKPARHRRSTRSDKTRPAAFSIPALILFLCVLLLVTALAYFYISTFGNTKDINDHRLHSSSFVEDDNDTDFLTNVTRTDAVRVRFGQGSAGHGRDSRYWDKDDRRRDEDYGEDDVENANKVSLHPLKTKNIKEKALLNANETDKVIDRKRIVGLYNENGRKELDKYEAEYEASLKDVGKSGGGNGMESELIGDEEDVQQNDGVDTDNEYDDGIDSHDTRVDEYGDSQQTKEEHSGRGMMQDEAKRENTSVVDNDENKDQSVANNNDDGSRKSSKKASNLKSQVVEKLGISSEHVSSIDSQSTSKPRSDSRKKPKRRKYSGSCVMKFLNSTAQLVEPFESRKFARFSLQYSEMEKKADDQEQWAPRFAGHQSLKEREESFLAHDQKINCGFVKGPEEFPSTGFDLTEDDTSYLSRCHIAVISCIFGNSDRLRSPAIKTVTRSSKKNVCFVMFVDEVTFHTLSSEGHMPDRAGFIGLWRIVVVKNLPYTDMRRVGKVPKLLPHRLFPSARYSIWLDSKLRLQQDPLLLLEYFLWRKGYEYAISNHYDRHCVWEEVAQNKRLNKYNHTVIDDQFSFYRADGLKRFSAADPNKLLPSNVPEGSLIIRAHTPMSNLFSCLWFNEVDRFTPRDQLSFAYTYQKLKRMNPDKPFYLNMFKDCERRGIAKLFRHRSDEKKNILQQEAATV